MRRAAVVWCRWWRLCKNNSIRNKLNEEISSIKTNAQDIQAGHPIERDKIKPGLNVFVSNMKAEGTIVSNISKDDTVQVQIGVMKMKIDIKYPEEHFTMDEDNLQALTRTIVDKSSKLYAFAESAVLTKLIISNISWSVFLIS